MILCLLPFAILPFFNVMVSDDFILGNLIRQNGFIKTQQIVYSEWTGRYTSTFLGSLFVKLKIVDNWYFLHSLLLFLCTWLAFFFLLTRINKYILDYHFSNGGLLVMTFLLFFLNVYTQADIASAFYWFSAAMTYQTAFIFFLFFLGFLIRRFFSATKKGFDSLAIVLLILLICGCNEAVAVFLILFLSLLACFYYRQRSVSKTLLFYLSIAVAVSLFILFSSGVIGHRQGLMNKTTSYWAMIPMVAFRSLSVFYYILREPLFWGTSLFLFFIGVKCEAILIKKLLDKLANRRIILSGLVLILLLVVGTLTPILVVSKGALPLRMLNNIIALTTLCLLFIFFLAGSRHAAVFRPIIDKIPSSVLIVIVSCNLLLNSNYIEAWKSVFSGYFYHAVMEDRRQLLLSVRESGQRTVTIRPYRKALEEKIHQIFPHGIFAAANELLVEPPRMLFYYNDGEPPSQQYLDYYNLDTVIMKGY